MTSWSVTRKMDRLHAVWREAEKWECVTTLGDGQGTTALYKEEAGLLFGLRSNFPVVFTIEGKGCSRGCELPTLYSLGSAEKIPVRPG